MKPEMMCETALEQMDRFMDGALTEAETEQFAAHAGECAKCQAELELRERMRAGLRRAIRQPVDTKALEQRVHAAVRVEASRRFRWQPHTIALAATLLIAAGVGAAYQLHGLWKAAVDQDSYIAKISDGVTAIMRVGLKDHIHCVTFRKWPKQSPKLDELVTAMEPKFRPVAAIVNANLPKTYEIVKAHHCAYQDRNYVHIAMRDADGKYLSLVLARKQAGETFASSSLRRVLDKPNFAVYGENVERFQIAGFETRDFLAYVIGDTTTENNSQLAGAIAAPLREFLDSLEG